jgi:hypothetical protein
MLIGRAAEELENGQPAGSMVLAQWGAENLAEAYDPIRERDE